VKFPLYLKPARIFSHLPSTALLLTVAVVFLNQTRADDTPAPAEFDGPKTQWHGFDRYDFVMDEKTFEIQPYDAPAGEGDGIQGDTPGKRRCIVVVPRQAAPGNPWSWRSCYWDHEPQTEIELLKRGFHVAYVAPDPSPAWDAWYVFLTRKHGFSTKPAFVGMSKGGVNAFQWAVANPDKVGCIYADNPALYPQDFAKVGDLALHDIPLLHVCGSSDYLLFHHTLEVEDIYHLMGGRISIMIKEGLPHHPHSLRDPRPIADWIEKNVQPDTGTPPNLSGITFVKSYCYSYGNKYTFFPSENAYVTTRGPAFTGYYDRYDAQGREWSLTGLTIIAPQTEAPGKPWVFRANRIGREQPSAVDLGLLARGFYIVAAPIDTALGSSQVEWDSIYQALTNDGFSKKPALEGSGAAAGESYAWAIQNPDKVACIYAENPVMRSLMSPNLRLLDSLDKLSQANIPLLHVCGSLDPALADNSTAVEKQYKALNGQITVILKDGVAHYPLGPVDPQPVIDFISQAVPKS
jgi:pimeloyl-ACP methyl ester carboxylesterase